jgi:hypothetical protein
MLNQGPETSLVFKTLIAEYLDIPMGKMLLYKNASRNLPSDSEIQSWRIPDADDGNNRNNNIESWHSYWEEYGDTHLLWEGSWAETARWT